VGATLVSATLIDRQLDHAAFLAGVAGVTASQVLAVQFSELFYADGNFQYGGTWNVVVVVAGLAGLTGGVALEGGAAELLLAQATGQLLALAAEYVALSRRNMLHRSRSATVKTISALIRRGIPTVGFGVGLVMAQRADRYLLGAFDGPAAVGIYSL